MTSVASDFKAVRKILSLTQNEFAEKTGISLDRVKNIEAGRIKYISNVEIKTLVSLGISIDWILYKKGDIIKSTPEIPDNLMLNVELLKSVIVMFEGLLSRNNKYMSPEAKATAIVKLYEICFITGENIKEENIKRLLNIV